MLVFSWAYLLNYTKGMALQTCFWFLNRSLDRTRITCNNFSTTIYNGSCVPGAMLLQIQTRYCGKTSGFCYSTELLASGGRRRPRWGGTGGTFQTMWAKGSDWLSLSSGGTHDTRGPERPCAWAATASTSIWTFLKNKTGSKKALKAVEPV